MKNMSNSEMETFDADEMRDNTQLLFFCSLTFFVLRIIIIFCRHPGGIQSIYVPSLACPLAVLGVGLNSIDWPLFSVDSLAIASASDSSFAFLLLLIKITSRIMKITIATSMTPPRTPKRIFPEKKM